MSEPKRRFVVTTRSRLRGPHLFPQMFEASQAIQDELGETPGAERAVSVVAGPEEFFTVSVWNSRHLMQEFMRSGAHGEIMWQLSQWVASFWQMRWRPTRHEYGTWDGLSLAPPRGGGGGGDGQDGERGDEVQSAPGHVREEVLESIPNLREAIGPEGAPSYEASPRVREQRELVEGAGGVVIRIATRWYRTAGVLSSLRALRDDLEARDPELLRIVAGLGRAGECYLMGVWSNRASAARLVDSDPVSDLRDRYGEDMWVGDLLPENEFGQWDGLRLREFGEVDQLGPREQVR